MQLILLEQFSKKRLLIARQEQDNIRYEPVIKPLLATDGVDPDSKDSNGRTPLSWAAEKGYKAVVKMLLDTGKVDVDLKDKDSRTPLSWAAGEIPLPSRVVEKGYEAVVELLLKTTAYHAARN